MKINSYKCDVCQREYTPSNGWWLVQGGREVILQPMSGATLADIALADFHLCGRECLGKKSNELLDKLAEGSHAKAV